MLSKSMKRYLLKKDKRGYNKSSYDSRVKAYAARGIEDLRLLAEILPEEQLDEIFNKESLTSFFEALLRCDIPAKDHQEWLRVKETKDMLKKRKRLLGICWAVLQAIGDYRFAKSVLPSDWGPWLSMDYPPEGNVKAIMRAEQIE